MQNKTQAADKTATSASTATNVTSHISNTSPISTATASFQCHLLRLMLIKLLYALSPPLHHSVFLLLHSLFPMTNLELASISIDCSIRCQYPVHIQPTKSLPVLKLICWLVFWPIILWSTAMDSIFVLFFSFHVCFLLLILRLYYTVCHFS